MNPDGLYPGSGDAIFESPAHAFFEFGDGPFLIDEEGDIFQGGGIDSFDFRHERDIDDLEQVDLIQFLELVAVASPAFFVFEDLFVQMIGDSLVEEIEGQVSQLEVGSFPEHLEHGDFIGAHTSTQSEVLETSVRASWMRSSSCP